MITGSDSQLINQGIAPHDVILQQRQKPDIAAIPIHQ